jgi:hypothetical protein
MEAGYCPHSTLEGKALRGARKKHHRSIQGGKG